MAVMLSRDGVCGALENVLTLPIRQADLSIEKGVDDNGEAEFARSVLMTPDSEGGMRTPMSELVGQVTTAQIFKRSFFEKTFKVRPDDGKIIYDKIAYRPPATCQARYNDRSGEPNGFRQQVWLFGGNLMLSNKQKVPGYVDIPKVRSYIYTHGKNRQPLTGVSEMEIAYWPLANDALVQTPDGPVRMGDIQVGDRVYGANGLPTRVTAVHPGGRQQMYRVTLHDGASVECGPEHLWGVNDARKQGIYRVLPLSQIMAEGLHRQASDPRHWRFTPPRCEAVEFPERNLPIDPYILGAWLGDGCIGRHRHDGEGERTGHPSIAITEDFIAEEISSRLPAQMELRKSGRGSYSFVDTLRWHQNAFKDALVALGVNKTSSEKHIPEIYQIASVKQRLDMLRGLMDTDGCHIKGKRAVLGTVSLTLANDLQRLVRSLGGRASIRGPKFYAGKGRTLNGRAMNQNYGLYSVLINLDYNPFLLPRKADKWSQGGGGARQSNAIIKVEPTTVQECTCITVEADDGLFLADDYVVTHNCYQSKMKLLFLLTALVQLPRVPEHAAPDRLRQRPARGDPQR
jgi:hypothetical protein